VSAQIPALMSVATLTFDHFYLILQAAIDGIGIAMGRMPTKRGGL
jgi:LysR family transcriptional regulator, glycine cleavage system transcriptional activator